MSNKTIPELFPMLWDKSGNRKSRHNTEINFYDSFASCVMSQTGCSRCGQFQYHLETVSVEICLTCGNFVDYWYHGDQSIEKPARKIMESNEAKKVFKKEKLKVLWKNLDKLKEILEGDL